MVAFVLSGVASLGAIEAGMVRALYEHGIAPELIVGTSAGALNGAFLASRPPTVETAGVLAELWRSTTTWEVFPPNPITAALAFTPERDAFVSSSGVKRILRRHLDLALVQDAPVKLRLIATDVLDGAKVKIATGDACTAVLASAAIPGIFPSVEFEGHRLIDGGVSENTPISDAVDEGADTVYVLPTGAPCELPKPPRGAIPMLVHALTLLINQRLADDIARYSQQVRLIAFPPPCPQTVQAWDFGHADELLAAGYRSATEVLDSGEPEHPRWHALARERMKAPPRAVNHAV